MSFRKRWMETKNGHMSLYSCNLNLRRAKLLITSHDFPQFYLRFFQMKYSMKKSNRCSDFPLRNDLHEKKAAISVRMFTFTLRYILLQVVFETQWFLNIKILYTFYRIYFFLHCPYLRRKQTHT